MIQKKLFIQLSVFFIFNTLLYGQNQKKYERKLFFPDIDNYKTLLTDFHEHTVFSDGLVWPTIRIDEALKDGIDVISLTDHLEFQPFAKDIPNPDRNRAYLVANDFAERINKSVNKKLIIITGQEITRSMPPGHINAIIAPLKKSYN